MNKKVQNCFICDTQIRLFCKSIFKVFSKYTETPIYRFIEKFSGQSFTTDTTENVDNNDSVLCGDCIYKFDEYDLAMQTAERVQHELSQLMKETQDKYNEIIVIKFEDENENSNASSEDGHRIEPIDVVELVEEEPEEIKSDSSDAEYSSESDSDIYIKRKAKGVRPQTEYLPNKINTNCKVSRGTEKSKEKAKPKTKGPHVCKVCDKVFMAKSEFRVHVITHGSNSSTLVCHVCGMIHKSKSALDVHLTLHGEGKSQHECSVCGKQFRQKGTLARHMPIHTGEKSYQCDICGKQFHHTSSFKMHKRAHNGIKDKVCTVCGLHLRSTSHLSRHMRVHSGEKPYTCPTCGQKFAQRYNMMSHFKVHQGLPRTNKHQECLICGMKFAAKSKLDQHLSECHGKLPVSKAYLAETITTPSDEKEPKLSETTTPPTNFNYFVPPF